MKSFCWIIGLLLLMTFAVPSLASPLIWDFNPSNVSGNVGSSSYTVTNGGYGLTVSGFNYPSNTAHLLYWKLAGADEHGIGLVGTTDNEFTLTNSNTIANYAQINVGQIYHIGLDGEVRIQSVTNGEAYDIFGSNTAGSLGTLLGSNITADNSFVNIPQWGTWQYIGIAVHTPASSSADNILVDAVQSNDIPEPTTLALLGLGLVGLIVRRRRKVCGSTA